MQFIEVAMFVAVVALLIQYIHIPRKADRIFFFACSGGLLGYYLFRNMLFLLTRPDLSMWFWQESHILQGWDFWPGPVTFIPFLVQFFFLMWFWQRQAASLISRTGLILLFTALWILPTDLEWIGFTTVKWWGVQWYIGLMPWPHIVYELVALNAGLVAVIPLIRKGILHWDRWTLLAELANIFYLMVVFLPAASPWSTDLNIWLDLKAQMPPAVILWTLRVGSRSVNFARWFTWIRPWRKLPD